MVTSIIPAGTVAPPVPESSGPSDIVRVSMDTVQGFEALQRVAKLFMASSLVPKRYQGPENLPNTVIALNLAFRMGADPLQVMQHLNVVYGVPCFDAQFLIASVNSSGRFTPLRYEWKGARGSDDWGCRAWAYEVDRRGVIGKEKLFGAWVDINIAKAEGWFDRKDKSTGAFCSKWRTIPEQMLMYRAASYWVRTRAPEVSMGMRDREEVEDVYGGQIVQAQSTPVLQAAQAPHSPQLQAPADVPAPQVAPPSNPHPVTPPPDGGGGAPFSSEAEAGPEEEPPPIDGPAAGQTSLPLGVTSESPAAGPSSPSPAPPLPDQWALLEQAMESAGTIREVKKLSVQLARAPAELKERIRATYDRCVARFSQQ